MESTGTDEVDKLKTKFISAWHNMKYSWVLKTKTYFSRNSPVFLLGKCYHFKSDELHESLQDVAECPSVENEDLSGNVEEFRKDFISRIWLTYREEFPPLAGSGSAWTTDCGWGCTLRTGQMLLAQALVLHFLGRATLRIYRMLNFLLTEWNWPQALDVEHSESDMWTALSTRKITVPLEYPLFQKKGSRLSDNCGASQQRNCEDQETKNECYHRKIISWFADCPEAFFGLHQLTEHGKHSGKLAGDWYGPAIVAHLLRKSVADASVPELQGITIYVAQDCTGNLQSSRCSCTLDINKLLLCGLVVQVYSEDVFDKQRSFGSEKAVIILVPVRLGGERTNLEYYEFVKGILSLEYCVGIIGGKPKQSYYFVGFQDDSLIYMDPHYCQAFVDVSMKDFPLQSFHCSSPKKMSFKKMDPSCTIGFYCRNVQDFEKVAEEVSRVLKSSSKEKYPLFTFVQGHSKDYDFESAPAHGQNDLLAEDERKRLQRFNTDDFVLL